ncbi:hypothetical protein [Streptomyces sp. SPB78]|uniref:hypothetical protein n=1 Tax=Streptomyces sp. (strain SPB78) TaxID=591157 RepID=UPI0001B56EC5|nr:hypothetical protein [Streptomyces sp. SPB78]
MGAPHWHAYAWTGREHPPLRDARDPSKPVPPSLIADWLLKPRSLLVATFAMPDEGGHAYAWLETQLKKHPRGPRDWPPRVDLDGAHDRLTRQTDVVWGYWSATGLYVARVLITCPRSGIPCPHAHEDGPAHLAKDPGPSSPALNWRYPA